MTTSDTRSLGESTKDHGAGAAACKDFSVQELDAAGSPAPGSSCAAIVPQLGAMGLGCTDDLGAIGLSGASACDMCCDTCGAEACGVSLGSPRNCHLCISIVFNSYAQLLFQELFTLEVHRADWMSSIGAMRVSELSLDL